MNQTINETINQTALSVNSNLPFAMSPTIDIFIIALLGSLFITLINKYMSDQVRIKALREEMKQLRKKHREIMMKDPKKAQKIQQQLMEKSLENMRHAMNPKILLITMIPMLLLFVLVKQYYSPFGEFLNFFNLTEFGWLGTYIIFSIINSIILKKVLDVA